MEDQQERQERQERQAAQAASERARPGWTRAQCVGFQRTMSARAMMGRAMSGRVTFKSAGTSGHAKAREQGYTLIELMAVVLIAGILAAIAYPTYTGHLWRAHRAEARAALQEAQQYMERYHAVHHRYTTSADQPPVLPWRLRTVPEGTTAEAAHYQLSVSEATAYAYTLRATPAPGRDEACGSLTLTHTGLKGRTGSGRPVEDCWR
jgi:type IV pilus assembly protein PilE